MDDEERIEDQQTEEGMRKPIMKPMAARAGYAAGQAVGGVVAAGGAAAGWLGARLMPQPQPGEKQETFDEYAFGQGRDAELSPEETDDLFSTKGIEENDSIPEIDGTRDDDDELQNVDETIYGDPSEEDPMSTEGIDEHVLGDTEEVITGVPTQRQARQRSVYATRGYKRLRRYQIPRPTIYPPISPTRIR